MEQAGVGEAERGGSVRVVTGRDRQAQRARRRLIVETLERQLELSHQRGLPGEAPPVAARARAQQLPGHLQIARDRFARAQRLHVADRRQRRAVERRRAVAAEARGERGQALADARPEHAGVAAARARAQGAGLEQRHAHARPRRRQVIGRRQTGQPAPDDGHVGVDGFARGKIARGDRGARLLPDRRGLHERIFTVAGRAAPPSIALATAGARRRRQMRASTR